MGKGKSTDIDGIYTLEVLNKAIIPIRIWEADMFFVRRILHPIAGNAATALIREKLCTNVPYFRYAMAYRV